MKCIIKSLTSSLMKLCNLNCIFTIFNSQNCIWMNYYLFMLIFIYIILAVVGFILSSLLTFIVIKKNSWNDFNVMIALMSFSEAVFFLGFSNYSIGLGANDQNSTLIFTLEIIMVVGDVISYSVSSFMAFSIAYLIIFKKILSLKDHKYILLFVIIAPQVIWLPISLVGLCSKPINYDHFINGISVAAYFILVPVIFNCLVYIATFYQGTKMFNYSRLCSHDIAIITLIERLKWYVC